MIRNIVFDMGMVMMDYRPLDACRAVAPDEDAAQRLNAALFGRPDWARMDEGTIEESEMALLAQETLRDEALNPLVTKLLEEMPFNVLTPIPGMAEVVDWVLEQGFRAYVLSNATLRVSRNRNIIPRMEKFHGAIFSADEKIIKPDARIYRRLTDRYGLVPEECFFIDDNENNVAGALGEGWQGCCFAGDIAALSKTLAALKNGR